MSFVLTEEFGFVFFFLLQSHCQKQNRHGAGSQNQHKATTPAHRINNDPHSQVGKQSATEITKQAGQASGGSGCLLGAESAAWRPTSTTGP